MGVRWGEGGLAGYSNIPTFLSYGIWLEHGYGLGIKWVLTSASSFAYHGHQLLFLSVFILPFPAEDSSLSCRQEKQRRIRKCFRIFSTVTSEQWACHFSGNSLPTPPYLPPPPQSEKGHFYYLKHFPASHSVYYNLQPPAIPPTGTRTGLVCPHFGPPPQRIGEASLSSDCLQL